MVDVTDKPLTERMARAEGTISMKRETIQLLTADDLPKGNVLTTAKLAGIQAAKKTSDLIPLCHPLNVSWVDIEFEVGEESVEITAVAKTKEATGIEMEALTAVSVAALPIYDMCKAVDEGKSEDTSGGILKEGLSKHGCRIEHDEVIPDDSGQLKSVLERLVSDGFELVVSSGGTGVGPYDITIETVEPMLTQRLPGVEQALHSYGRSKTATAMLSRLLAGRIGDTFFICLPGSPGAAKDALAVLMPSFLHVFPMAEGERH